MSADGHDDRAHGPLILCANDDGFFSRGLEAVVEALSRFARVVVVAPEAEQSATSHSLTLHRPLRLRATGPDRYALDGTPADCVYLALHLGEAEHGPRVLPRRPDLIVSGINRGINLGQDVFYSGTVAAAREGALRGIPAIAASVEVAADAEKGASFEPQYVAGLTARLARAMLALPSRGGDEPAPLLNLNAPAGPIRGVRATRLGTRLWDESVATRIDPRGRVYYWLGGFGVRHHLIDGSDTEAFDAGLASISPLRLDLASSDAATGALMSRLLRALDEPA